ncbi:MULTISPECIES: TraB/GumN family protein [unclassified Brevundimonas]|uniref:TraB/GumN family protein n=1 Tax=unclassified Brevundimonas TaxID=2622653 RepID=UPI003F9183F9
MRIRDAFWALGFAIFAFAAGAQAQTDVPTTVDEIVVVARRAEAPIWHVRRGDDALILVGAVEGLPRDLEWRPEALQAAADGADRVLFPPARRASFADIGRLIWRARSAMLLADGKTSADYLSPEMQARFIALADDTENRVNLTVSADRLLVERAGYVRRSRAAAEVVRTSARKRRVQVEPTGVLHGDEMIEMLISTPPSVHVPCMEATIAAAEAGPESAAQRAEAWRRRDVQAVLNSPLEKAINVCWPWGAAGPEARLRSGWNAAIDEAVRQPGVTLAVAPLHLLAETNGILDRLQAQGLDVSGPPWRAGAQ